MSRLKYCRVSGKVPYNPHYPILMAKRVSNSLIAISTKILRGTISFDKLCREYGDMFEGDSDLIRDGENYFVKDIPDVCYICCNGNVVKVR